MADTPWAACLVAEEGDVCPHNFKKLETDHTACRPRGYRTPPYKKRLCCLLGPVFEIKVIIICIANHFQCSKTVENVENLDRNKKLVIKRILVTRLTCTLEAIREHPGILLM